MKKYCFQAIALPMLVLVFSNVMSQCPDINPIYRDLVEWRLSNMQKGISHNVIKAQITAISPERGGSFHTAWGKSLLMANGPCILMTDPTIFIKSDEIYNSNSRIQPFSNKTEHRIKERTITLDMAGNRIIDKIYGPNQSETIYTNLTRIGDVIYGTKNAFMIIINFKKSSYSGDIVPMYRTLDLNQL